MAALTTADGRPNAALIVAAAVVSLGAAMLLQVTRDRSYPLREQEAARMLYVRSPEAAKRLALEFDALAADVYWIRAIQHYGGDRKSSKAGRSYELLYPLLDMTTTLDPYFTLAYRFGAIFLSEAPPEGPGRSDLAERLLRKGISVQPTKWQYYYDVGFVHYWHLRDYKVAAEWFQRAADQPNAPNWLRPLIASMLTTANDRASARFLWQQMLQSDQDWLRRNAQHRLMQLDTLDLIDQLDAFIKRYPGAPGEAFTWQALMRRSPLRQVPTDASGTPLHLDPDTGRVTVSSESPLLPMPELGARPPS
jgi:tetratricopeptide (TPR) repeat protein